MKGKKILAMMVLLVITCASCFASILQLGAVGSKQFALGNEIVMDDFMKPENYTWGAEARINLPALTLSAEANLGKAAAGEEILVRTAFGAQARIGVNAFNVGIGAVLPHYLCTIKGDDMNTDFLSDRISLKASMNLNILFAGLSVSYVMPTNVPLKGVFDFGRYGDYRLNTKTGKVQVAFFLNLI